MAHLVETMAYVGETPWHGLGNQLPPKQPLEVWAKEAGMNWRICESPVRFVADVSEHLEVVVKYPEQKVLYRSDSQLPLSVVSERYKVVQPMEVLEFYRDLTECFDFELETAGVLKFGKKFWALARTGRSTVLKGNDLVNGYVLLATSCDGTLATTVTPTTVRVVCNNTLSVALDGASRAIKVPHSTVFNAEAIKRKLDLSVPEWDDFMYRMKLLSERKVKAEESTQFYKAVFNQADLVLEDLNIAKLPNDRAMKKAQSMFEGHGRGAELQAAKGTAWGLLSSITEFVDHERQARNRENRLDSAWFGQGAAIKQRALIQALQMVA